MAFPRINALSFWIFIFSGLFFYSSFLVGQAPNGGWYAYPPLTGPQYTPGLNMDFWTLGIIFLGVSTTAGAINFIVTIFKLRAPGMSIGRMPIFIWNVLVMAFAIIFALPSLTVGSALLFLDRRFGMHFFDPLGGGDPLLWQHLFWIFGHPDVYILFFAPLGLVSTVIPVFSRRPIVGYALVAMSAITIGFISFGVWVHHMFATGLSLLEMSYFSAASIMIPIPSAVQMFAWISTIWNGKVFRSTAFMFMAGFLVLFVMGGVTGVMQAVVPFDWQVTKSYWVVAHFHYVLIGTVLFPVIGGFYYWFPKITGRMLSEKLGHWSFWLMFIGFNLGFFVLHIVGLNGLPRRVYTYMAGLGWEPFMLVSAIGIYILATGILLTVINFLRSLREGVSAGDNPWNAPSLEWSVSSPPPPYNFREIPVVRSRDPLWYEESSSLPPEQTPPELSNVRRETYVTTLTDGIPEAVITMPGPSYWPLILAIGLTIFFVGLLASSIFGAVAGIIVTLGGAIGWLFPKEAFY